MSGWQRGDTMQTVDELMKQAFDAAARGDLAERERLCRLAMNMLEMSRRHRAGEKVHDGDEIVVRPATPPAVIYLPDRSQAMH